MESLSSIEVNSVLQERIKGLRCAEAHTVWRLRMLGIPQHLIDAAFMLDDQAEYSEAENCIIRVYSRSHALPEESTILILNGDKEDTPLPEGE